MTERTAGETTNGLNAEVIFACLLPIGLFIFSLQVLNSPPLSFRTILDIIRGPSRGTAQTGHFSLHRAIHSYDEYRSMALSELNSMRSSYSKVGRAHKRIGYELGYPRKLNRLQEVTEANAIIARAIASLARVEFSDKLREEGSSSGSSPDLGRVRETMKHFVRDWSTEGREERETIFGPILAVLSEVPVDKRAQMKVLVPGSGLGRLAWEISELGFDTVAIELSFFMTLGLRFLFSPSATQHANQHIIYPYANWFSHNSVTDNLFRGITFPDVVPRSRENLHVVEGDFLEHHFPSSGPEASEKGYDFIVTLFFIDTSMNIFATLEHMYALLRPGGTWINLGPLLWTSGGQARAELSLEEVLKLAEMVGFRIENNQAQSGCTSLEREGRARRTVECEYTADKLAMMKWIYRAEFWVATKTDL